MTLNGVIARNLRYFTEFDWTPITSQWLKIDLVSAQYRLPLMAKTDPPCSAVSMR